MLGVLMALICLSSRFGFLGQPYTNKIRSSTMFNDSPYHLGAKEPRSGEGEDSLAPIFSGLPNRGLLLWSKVRAGLAQDVSLLQAKLKIPLLLCPGIQRKLERSR